MSVLLLVRHGQASFGEENYDRLSRHGESQARALGRHVGGRLTPDRVISGSLSRQRATATLAAASAGWSSEPVVDPAWNELDHDALVRAASGLAPADPHRYQNALEASMRQWADGDEAGDETFSEFRARVDGALERIAEHARGSTVVFTSAGVISWIVTSLLAGSTEQWVRLNRVCVNTGITTVVVGRRGLSLVSFNEHGHLPLSELSYR